MRRKRRWIVDLLCLTGLLSAILLHVWFPDVGSGQIRDTYSATPEGKKVFFRLVEWHSDYAERLSISLLDQVDYLDYEDTLCVLGPARYPTEGEWARLLDWVSWGGSLLVAARYDDPEFAIEPLGINVAADDTSGDGAIRVAESLLDGGEFEWRSNAQIETEDADVDSLERLIEQAGTAQAVRCRYGEGTVVVVASDFLFSNRSLATGDNSVLAYRLLEATSDVYYVCFDESLNVSGTPKVVGLLLDPFLRPLTIQLVVVLVVFGWWRSRRFGPIQPSVTAARHNIVDHTDAVGALTYRSHDGRGALQSYLQHLPWELRGKRANATDARVIASIAYRAEKSPQAVRDLIAQANEAAAAESLDRRRAAQLIHSLAELRAAALKQQAAAGDERG